MAKKAKQVFEAFQSLGYDWNSFHVYKHPLERGKYVAIQQGGCSCNSYVTPSIETLSASTPLGKREVYAVFSKWFGRGDYMQGTKIANMERLRSSL